MCSSVILMIKVLGPIVDHGHDVGVVVLVVIVEGVEENAEADPLIAGAEYRSFQPLALDNL